MIVPVAYLKTWIRDGEERKRVDLYPEPDAWMDNFKATPLYAIPSGFAVVPVEQVKDAERWQALLNCGRVKLQGWAGVDTKPGDLGHNDIGYVHFGAEFWTNAFEEKHYSAEAKAEAQKVLIAFADGAIKTAMLTAAAKGE